MILIISEDSDQSTNEVIDYLNLYGVNYIRINQSSNILIKRIILSNSQESIALVINDGFEKNRIVALDQIKGTWYRRGDLKIQVESLSTDFKYWSQLSHYLNNEVEDLVEFIHFYIKNTIPSINSFLDNSINKLIVLYIAKKNGLKIPYTLLSSFPKYIKKVEQGKGPFITKDIRDGRVSFIPNSLMAMGKVELLEYEVDAYNYYTFPNLVQSLIIKEYEIRTFYLMGEFYSTAIFSQSNERTKIDFRNYDFSKMNRVVPYFLPSIIQKKIEALFVELDMNCGSVDIIKSHDGNYVFLEINPIGQYSQVSVPGNFNISEKIALKLKEFEFL